MVFAFVCYPDFGRNAAVSTLFLAPILIAPAGSAALGTAAVLAAATAFALLFAASFLAVIAVVAAIVSAFVLFLFAGYMLVHHSIQLYISGVKHKL